GNELAAERAVRVGAVDEREVVRRRADAEQARGGGEPGALLGGEVEERGDVLGGDRVAQLPAPVVPLLGGDVPRVHRGYARDDGEALHRMAVTVPLDGCQPEAVTRLVVDGARALGFHRVGVSAAAPAATHDRFVAWLEAGYAAGKAYMAHPAAGRAPPARPAPPPPAPPPPPP